MRQAEKAGGRKAQLHAKPAAANGRLRPRKGILSQADGCKEQKAVNQKNNLEKERWGMDERVARGNNEKQRG